MCAADVDAEGPRGPCEARLQVDAQGKKLATKKDYYCTAGTHSAAELLRSVRRRAGARRCRYQLGTGWDRILHPSSSDHTHGVVQKVRKLFKKLENYRKIEKMFEGHLCCCSMYNMQKLS